MAEQRNRNYLRQEFRDGERPSGDDFADLFESFFSKKDDGLSLDGDGNLKLSRGICLGDSAASAAGALRFNGGKVQFQNGSGWQDVGTGSGGSFKPVGAGTAIAYDAGNVGIGTFAAPPTYKLEVAFSGAEAVRFGNSVCHDGSSGTYACFSHKQRANDTDFALRQGVNGNVHINTPTNQPFSIRQAGMKVCLGVSANSGCVVVGSEATITGITAAFQVIGDSYTSGKVDVKGDLTALAKAYRADGKTTWDTPSDARLKEDVRDLEFGLEELVRVRPVRFRYNGKAGTSAGTESVGIVAQEIAQIFPEMVHREKCANPGEVEGDEFLVSNPSALTFVLVNAIKQLAGRVNELEARLAEARNDPVGIHKS